MRRAVFVMVMAVVLACGRAFAMCGSCGSGHAHHTESPQETQAVFSQVAKEAVMKDGVKEITYSQFIGIRDSKEKYVLLDVLSSDSYNEGHIEGAVSFPLDTINKVSAEKKLSKSDNIIVYCGSFQCSASTEAAKALSKLGYNVLDYKGGLREWQEKGNGLVR